MRRCAIRLTFDLNTYCYRNNRGGRLVEVLEQGHSAPDIDRWIARARGLPSAQLAAELGVSDRHARRIKSGDITDEGLRALVCPKD